MFLNLRHLTYEIIILTKGPNSHSGLLQLSQYLAFVPQLEALELDVSGFLSYFCLPFFFPFFSAEQKATSVGLIMDGPKKIQLFGYADCNTDRVVFMKQMVYHVYVGRCWRGDGISYSMRLCGITSRRST